MRKFHARSMTSTGHGSDRGSCNTPRCFLAWNIRRHGHGMLPPPLHQPTHPPIHLPSPTHTPTHLIVLLPYFPPFFVVCSDCVTLLVWSTALVDDGLGNATPTAGSR